MTQPNTQILREAAEITEGRSDTHGAPEDSFLRIARYWNDYLVNENGEHPGITPGDVADLLALFKLARSQGGEHNPDDNRDRVGYISFAESFKMEQETQTPNGGDVTDEQIDDLARDVETAIQEGREMIDSLPEFEDRRKSNTVQLRKVLNGEVEGMVIDDE